MTVVWCVLVRSGAAVAIEAAFVEAVPARNRRAAQFARRLIDVLLKNFSRFCAKKKPLVKVFPLFFFCC